MCPWDGYASATIAFCERRLCAWIVEPSNAWSNLAYVAVGAWILGECRPLLGSARTAIGAAAIALGLGSFAFHATGIRVFEVVDVAGMYLVSGLALTFALRRLCAWSERRALAFFPVLVAVSIALMVGLGNDGILVFGAQVLLVIGLELRLRERNPPGAGRWLLASVGVLFLGLGIWLLDFHGPLCDPDNHLVTGHAVWHVLTALSILLFDRFQVAVQPAAYRGAPSGLPFAMSPQGRRL